MSQQPLAWAGCGARAGLARGLFRPSPRGLLRRLVGQQELMVHCRELCPLPTRLPRHLLGLAGGTAIDVPALAVLLVC